MGATTGFNPTNTYGVGTVASQLAALIDLIPNPDAPHGTGAVSGGNYLDEMSPGAAAELRVELAALSAANDIAWGSHTITAGEASANLVDIVTGISGMTLSHCAVSVWNGTTLATSDAAITEPVDGTIRVADGSTYNTVAGYVIVWLARK